jgi:outer membrane biosynthesis protein TonB
MLERARATSLALLGATAAVGLAIVALALHQSWPLIAGSPIPPLQPRKQAIGPAAIVSPAGVSGPVLAGAHGRGAPHGGPAIRSHPNAAGDATGNAPVPSAVPVVAPSQPVESGPAHQAEPPSHPKAPSKPQPAQPTPIETQTVASSPPEPEPAPAPASGPAPAPAPPTPVATVTETSPEEESNLPPWSHGHGHGYGRSEGWHGHGWGDDGD